MVTIAKARLEIKGSELKGAHRAHQEREAAKIENLIDAAMSVLHHDGDGEGEIDQYERDQLRSRFVEILQRR